MNVLKYIQINNDSNLPKYQQIVDSFIYNISVGNFTVNQKMPSISLLSNEFKLSKDTVAKAYNILKKRNIIISIRGMGTYILKKDLTTKNSVLFFINKISSYKMVIYNSFINCLGNNIQTDLCIYHCDESLFLTHLRNNINSYDYYVIMPHFKINNSIHASSTLEVLKLIYEIPKEKIIIIDNKLGVECETTEIYQDYENDIYSALKQGLSKIKKYKTFFLVYPNNTVYPYPRRILRGFENFCIDHNFEFNIIEDIYEEMVLEKGDLFIIIEEFHLVDLLRRIKDYNFITGKDIGVISYNDTLLKDLLGITVISTDFKHMGEMAADIILKKEYKKIKNPFNLIERSSI